MLRVLELYSGIGGFHYALTEAQVSAMVVAAADINNIANDIYRHNFSQTNIIQRCIESLSVEELEEMSPDLIHLSPPCQPFVRVGKQQDKADARSKSFLHILTIIPQMQKQPRYIFLENVRGFDSSESRDLLLQMLEHSGYIYQEFLLSPVQFGVPNSRLRYYLMAKLKPLTFAFEVDTQIRKEIPGCVEQFLCHKQHQTARSSQQTVADCEHQSTQITQQCSQSASSISDHAAVTVTNSSQYSSDLVSASCVTADSTASSDMSTDGIQPHLYKLYQHICRPLSDFLEQHDYADYFEEFSVPEKFLKRFWVMDIVKPHQKNCCCFTKRYGHHIEGAGSVIQTTEGTEVDLSQYKRDRVYTDVVEQGVRSLRLRFFTPREIANLMCFPPDFDFPPEVSTKQGYRALGNSLNVHVVSVLLRLLLMDSTVVNT